MDIKPVNILMSEKIIDSLEDALNAENLRNLVKKLLIGK